MIEVMNPWYPKSNYSNNHKGTTFTDNLFIK